jgi:hypothetical protein
MKTKLIDFIPFTEYVTYGGRLIKAQRSITIKEQQIDQALMIYHVVVSITIEIVIEMVKQLTT